MKVETKEDACLCGFDLWLELAVTGSNNKSTFTGWRFNSGVVEECVHDCPCCEFVKVIKGMCCVCPIRWASTYCESFGSEFDNWCKAKSTQEYSKWALEIAILHLEALTE